MDIMYKGIRYPNSARFHDLNQVVGPFCWRLHETASSSMWTILENFLAQFRLAALTSAIGAGIAWLTNLGGSIFMLPPRTRTSFQQQNWAVAVHKMMYLNILFYLGSMVVYRFLSNKTAHPLLLLTVRRVLLSWAHLLHCKGLRTVKDMYPQHSRYLSSVPTVKCENLDLS